ncbi:hypothetical protein BDV38DRAFT_13837 [Aspergillus pseudotamarii]|uniref:Uncharacterized protein n=1 Tax=Aspergillus pseudotamarii TaxID=132259 RepID=A0A5N6SAB6_ASPPS|nr:uncharacterized protein BDV38DRAFT_13837 [Aspergillus pseudotamarii]KAE8131668.1 hypothetical protein BDV38DRAFT_13837 [Aspergillus pseudotamarii]
MLELQNLMHDTQLAPLELHWHKLPLLPQNIFATLYFVVVCVITNTFHNYA